MSEKNITQLTGLHTSSNSFSATPDGALVDAHNVVMLNKGVIEPRRGQEPLSVGTAEVPDAVFFHDGRLLYHSDDGDNLNLLATTEDAVTTLSGTYTAPDRANGRVKTVTADNRTYFTSSKGPYRLESVATTPVLAGAPRAIDIYDVQATSETDGFLAIGHKCAYRILFGKEDAQGNLVLGAPSGRAFGSVAEADTTSRNMQITLPLPPDVAAGDFYRVYRSEQKAFAGVNKIEPDDNLYLVLWKEITSAEVTAGYLSVIDSTPEAFLGDPLYSNSTEEGILQENSTPPVALDMCIWKERMWFANTKQEQRLEIQLLGVGEGQDGQTGLRAWDSVIIDGESYTAHDNTWVLDNNSYHISTQTDPSFVIEETARQLVAAINRNHVDSSVSAYYASGADDLPGKILLRAKEKGTNPFAVTLVSSPQQINELFRESGTVVLTFISRHGFAVGDTFNLTCTGTPNANFPTGVKTITAIPSNGQISYVEAGADADVTNTNYYATRITPEASWAWNPELPTSGTSVSSDADEAPHRLYFSKLQQYEAVPNLNYVDIGVKDKAILRIAPLQDILVVFKEDGLFAVNGTTSQSIQLIDENVILVAPDTVKKVSSKLLGLTNQGVVSITQTGYDIVSRPIENIFVRLVKLDSSGFAALKRNSFAISRETDRLYLLYPITNNLASPEERNVYVYNVILNAWTTWDPRQHTTGGVNPVTDRLYLLGEDGFYKERRNLNETDYCDATYTNTAAGSTATYITCNSSITGQVYPGYVLEVTSGAESGTFLVVTQVDVANKRVYTHLAPPTFGGGEGLRFYAYFECRVKPNTILGGSPNQGKQFREFKVHFKARYNRTFTVSTVSDLDRTVQVLEITDPDFNIDDSLEWGVWHDPYVVRDLIPAAHQICTYLGFTLGISEAQAYWQLNGLSFTYEPLTESTMR